MANTPPLSSDSKSGRSFRGHVQATLTLGLPLVGAQIAQMAIGVTDTVMIGWLGAQPLAAGVLGAQLFFIVFIFGAGFAFAIVPISANAMGAGDERSIRRCVRMGMWLVMVYAIVGILIMSQSQAIYNFLGQEAANIILAEDYLAIAMWGIIPALLSMALRSFLTALELTRMVLIATIGGVLLNIVLNYALIFGNFGAPRMELVGAAWASVGTHALIAGLLVVYILLNRSAKKYAIFSRIWVPDWQAFREVIHLGFPISITVLAEVGLFHAASIMMGWIGTVQLAAHGVAIQIASVAFMVPLGFGNAATVRVGNALGRKDALAVGRAGYAAASVVMSLTVAIALFLLAFPSFLAGLFVDMNNHDAADVMSYAVPLILVAAAFQLVDSLQGVMAGVLRGMKDINVPMRLGIFSYWLVGLPAAYILSFQLGLNSVGIWIGLAIGLTVAAITLTWRFYHRERLGLMAI